VDFKPQVHGKAVSMIEVSHTSYFSDCRETAPLLKDYVLGLFDKGKFLHQVFATSSVSSFLELSGRSDYKGITNSEAQKDLIEQICAKHCASAWNENIFSNGYYEGVLAFFDQLFSIETHQTGMSISRFGPRFLPTHSNSLGFHRFRNSGFN